MGIRENNGQSGAPDVGQDGVRGGGEGEMNEEDGPDPP